MRIGLVTGEYPPMEGGVGAFTRELALALRALDHDVYVFTRDAIKQPHEKGIEVEAAAGARWGWRTVRKIREWAVGSKLDILNIQFQTAAYDMHPSIHWTPRALYTAGIPTVTTFHDLRTPYLFPKAGPVRRWSVKLLARWSTGVIATDRADEAMLQNKWHIEHIRWIPIGSNVIPAPREAIDRDKVRANLGVKNGQLLISYFGFLNETKGALVLIEALDKLVRDGIDAQLIMIGGRAGASDPTNFAYGKRVDEAIARLGISERVAWSGFVDDHTVSGYFYASDITALPYSDGASLRRGTLMAALAHGRAIVTTTPAAPELNRVVETTAPGDAAALALQIATIWNSPAKRAELENAAERASIGFSWDGIARATADFYREMTGK